MADRSSVLEGGAVSALHGFVIVAAFVALVVEGVAALLAERGRWTRR